MIRFHLQFRRKVNKLKLRFHDLHHDFGTQLALARMITSGIMATMGHSSLQTTIRYIDLEEAEAVIENEGAGN